LLRRPDRLAPRAGSGPRAASWTTLDKVIAMIMVEPFLTHGVFTITEQQYSKSTFLSQGESSLDPYSGSR